VELLLRDGFADEEFIDLARAERDEAQEELLTVLKRALAERVLARPAAEVL
jgi:DNA-nicking Smr family endonuclease